MADPHTKSFPFLSYPTLHGWWAEGCGWWGEMPHQLAMVVHRDGVARGGAGALTELMVWRW